MGLTTTKDSVDIGIVSTNADAMLGFYRDILGLEYEAKIDMPGGITMHRLLCGTTVVKILTPENAPPATAPPGGIGGATGYRYFTISVEDLDGITAECEQAGSKVIIAPREIRPGVRIAMVEDPDSNWVEFLQQTG
jgi:catechol 2,3-dioxygenase-like lactoylglutathione lyase family enzyme